MCVQLIALLRSLSRGGSPIEELTLAGTNLCVTPLGLHAVDALSLVCDFMRPPHRLRKLDLRGTHLCGSSHDPANSYTLSGLMMLCEALSHPECVLEEMHLTSCGIKAEREEPQPSSLPPSVYGISMHETSRLAALHPKVRFTLLRHFDYPTVFKQAAQRKGLSLPSLEVLSRMEANEMSKLWEAALQAHAAHDSSEGSRDASAHASSEQWRSYERGFPSLRPVAQGGVHTSLMARHLSRELYEQLKEARTAGGASLHDVIRSGVRIPSHPLGCLASDAECYEKFGPLFDAIIQDWHGWNRFQGPPHRSDMDPSRVELPTAWEESMSPYLVSLRVEARRNFTDSPFTPSLDAAGRAAVERGAIALFDSLPHELRGGYHPLPSLDEQTALSLREEGLLFSQPDSVAIWAGAGASNPTEEESGWGAHRGVFRAAEGKFAILVNEEDHLRLVSYRQDSDLLAAFSTLADSLHALERAHALPSIAASARRGFLTVSPSNVGTGLRVTLTLRLPMLGKDKGTLEAVCSQLLQQVSKSAVLVGPAATSPPSPTLPSPSTVGPSEADADGDHLWDVSSKASVGVTEVLLVQGMVSMALRLVELERRLAAGACLLDAMTPPPPPPDPPPVLLARATRRCSSLRTFGLSGRPLPVRDWCGEASRLSLGTGALTNQDALFLAQLLRDHTSLRSLQLSQCRLTGPVAMQMVHSLAASFAATKTLHKPLQLSELRLDGNRLRVCGALALFQALEETVCPLHTLDLSATELCGGTVSLARVFGELRGSAVRISDDGHTALLGADGLCSVGPLLERDSGCYHVEWLVRQARALISLTISAIYL